MKSTIGLAVVAAALALPAIARADNVPAPSDQPADEPGVWRISTGINYSQGDYGDAQDTKVVSAPVAIKYRRGGFSVRVSVPFVSIDGPGNLIDTPQGRDAGFGDSGSGGTSNSGSSGSSGTSGSGSSGSGSSGSGSSGSSGSGSSGSGSSGSGSSGSGSSGSGSSGSGSSGSGGGSGSSGSGTGPSGGGTSTSGGGVIGVPGSPGSRRSGIGDMAVTLGYSLPLGATTALDLTGRLKIPTASTSKRLGTGKLDVTLGGDLVQDLGNMTFYLGARRKFIGKPAGMALRDTWGAGGGVSARLEGGTIIGADYDWQQSSSTGRGPSSEVTGWVNVGLTRKVRMQVFASTGFTTNSADFAGGLMLSVRLN